MATKRSEVWKYLDQIGETNVECVNTWPYRHPPFQRRVFSTAGLIVNRLRTRVSPEHVDMLIFF